MALHHLSDDDLEAYIDGLLEPERRAEVEAFLANDPRKAKLVEAMRLQNDALCHLGEEILQEPIPDRLRAVVEQLDDEAAERLRSLLFVQTPQRLAVFLTICLAGLLNL